MTHISSKKDAEHFDYLRLKKLEEQSIDDYAKFNLAQSNTPERLTAFIHQLSPWNMQRGIDSIREYVESEVTQALEELREEAVTPPGYAEVKVVTMAAIDNKIKELKE